MLLASSFLCVHRETLRQHYPNTSKLSMCFNIRPWSLKFIKKSNAWAYYLKHQACAPLADNDTKRRLGTARCGGCVAAEAALFALEQLERGRWVHWSFVGPFIHINFRILSHDQMDENPFQINWSYLVSYSNTVWFVKKYCERHSCVAFVVYVLCDVCYACCWSYFIDCYVCDVLLLFTRKNIEPNAPTVAMFDTASLASSSALLNLLGCPALRKDLCKQTFEAKMWHFSASLAQCCLASRLLRQ